MRIVSFAGLSFGQSQKGIYRELKLLACLLCFFSYAAAQTIAVTSPAANEAIGAHVFHYALKASCTSCSSVTTVKFLFNGELAGYAPLGGALSDAVRYASLNWDPYYVGNGQHSFSAVALSASGAAAATSAGVNANVWNYLPQQTCAYNATPSNACTDILVTAQPAASLTAITDGLQGVDWTMNTVSVKPSGGTSPAVVGSVTIATSASQTTLTTTGRTIASGSVVLAMVYGGNTGGTDTLTALADVDGNNLLASTSTTGCTSNAHRQFNNSRICWVKPVVHASANYTVTATWSTAQNTGQTIQLYELSGAAASNFIDAQVNDFAGGVSNPYIDLALVGSGIPLAAGNEMVLTFVSHRPGSGNPLATIAAPNFTSVQDSNRYTTSEYTAANGANWYGQEALTIAVHGVNAGVAKEVFTYVDGQQVIMGRGGVAYSASSTYTTRALSNTASTFNFWIDTSAYYNQPHQVTVVATSDTNCTGCANGAWTIMGQWEQTVTFANPALPSELTSSARDQKAVCASFPCAALSALTGTIHNTDGSTSAATIVSCVSNDTTIVTVTSPACVPTPVAYGATYVTQTEAGGLTRKSWIYVVAANNQPHFDKRGGVLTSYDPVNSLLVNSTFITGSSLSNFAGGGGCQFGYTCAQFAADYANAGYTAAEELGFTSPPGVSSPSTEAAWKAKVDSDVSAACAVLTNGIHPIGIMDSWVIGSNGLFNGSRGPGLTFVTPPLQYIYQSWAANCPNNFPIANTICDECTAVIGGTLSPCTASGGCIVGNNGFTQIARASGTCTATWTGFTISAVNKFVITGSGDANLDYNTSSGAPAVFNLTRIDNNSFTFPCAGANATFTAGSNPALQIHPLGYDTYNAAGAVCDNGQATGPCIDWPRYNALTNYHTWAHAGSSHAMLAYAPIAGTAPLFHQNYCGSGSLTSDYCDFYSSGPDDYLPTRRSLNSIVSELGNNFRAAFGTFATKATLIEGEGITADYALTGYPVTVVSCLGNTLTTGVPHNLQNIIPGISRLWVTGSSACNGEYYVVTAPGATTLTVLLAAMTFSGSATGSITFTGGATYTGVTMRGSPGDINGAGTSFMTTNCPADNIKNNRNKYFTTSTGNANYDNATWYYAPETTDSCVNNEIFWQVPNLSSTGGTAYIIADNVNIHGRNWGWNDENGPRTGFAVQNYRSILGGGGGRQYALGTNPQAQDRTQNNIQSMPGIVLGYRVRFSDAGTVNLEDMQAGAHPHWDTANSKVMFYCTSLANLLSLRLAKYTLQPWLNSPDYGQWYEAAARRDGSGNTALLIQQFADAPTTLVANLAPYLIAGQAVTKYLASCDDGIKVSTIPAGTASDTTVCQPGCFAAYVFDGNAASVIQPLAVGVRLADVPNASKVLVRYSYAPYAFQQQSDVLPPVYDCGTGACTLPVDRNLGTVYYQIQYLDTNGNVLATGDVQQL